MDETTTQKCDYCQSEDVELTTTPYMADIPAQMCRKCWDVTPIDLPFGKF